MATRARATTALSVSGLAGLTLLLVLSSSSCGGSTRREGQARSEIQELIRVRDFEGAVKRSEELHEENPDNPAMVELQRVATVAYLLHEGQEAIFDDRHEDALAFFEHAQAIAPESVLVQRWIDKTNMGIAESWLNVGLNLHASGDLGGAIAAYGAALDHVPGLPSALRGLEEVMVVRNHREGKGDDYYVDGVNALSEYWLDEARWRFSATSKYLPENGRASDRRGQTEEMLADERLVVAANLEQDGLFSASLSVYEQALRLDPDNPEALQGRERLAPEAEASTILTEAVMLVARERFDEALAQLDRAASLSERQLDRVIEMREEIATARLESVYQRALSYEQDQRYPEAIDVYGDLLSITDYYKDAQARRGTLEQYVEMAADYYDKAGAESDPVLRLEYLRAIRGFWNEYLDVADQILDLEARIGAVADDGEAGE